MKKGIKLFSILFISLLFSGCVKVNYEMSINNDKSMDMSIIMAYSKQLSEMSNTNTDDTNSDESENTDNNYTKTAQSNGYSVEDYDDGNYKGYLLKKHFNNIDDLSTDLDVKANISYSSDSKYLFKIKKGFFKNTYVANFKIADNNSYTESNYNDSIKNSMDLKFIVNLPNKAISNNATSIENDSKKLIWDYAKKDNDIISFEFSVYNTLNIIILIGSITLLIIIFIIIIIVIKKKKKVRKVLDDDIETLDVEVVNKNDISIEIDEDK